jgi:hypothetical protein
VSGECASLIARMLTVDSARRGTVADALEHDWVRRGQDVDRENLKSVAEALKSVPLPPVMRTRSEGRAYELLESLSIV